MRGSIHRRWISLESFWEKAHILYQNRSLRNMILGFSHQAICLSDFSAAADLLLKFGYVEQFQEIGLANSPEKRAFLNDLPTKMDLLYFSAPNRPAVELIHYPGPRRHHRSPYRLAVSPDLATEIQGSSENKTDRFGWIAPLCTPTIVLPTQRRERVFASYAILCSELEASKTFWIEGLGFRETSTANRMVCLFRNAALPQWQIELRLSEIKDLSVQYFLDNEGLNVLSFISNDVAADGLLLGSLGAKSVSGIFQSRVNQRNLMIQLICGPSGELIELISF